MSFYSHHYHFRICPYVHALVQEVIEVLLVPSGSDTHFDSFGPDSMPRLLSERLQWYFAL